MKIPSMHPELSSQPARFLWLRAVPAILKTTRRLCLTIVALGMAFAFSGCVGFHSGKSHRSTSIADYLFPKDEQPLVTPQMPVLELPLRVGIAFAPAANRPGRGFSAMEEERLLERVAESFRSQGFVRSIEVVPSAFLRPKGSFDNLDQIKRLMGIDVIVLVAYDQTQFTDDQILSLAYWTIVGAYVVPGNKNGTDTLIETAVFDIQSRSLLFHAVGASQIKSHSTGVGTPEQRREDSGKGLAYAMEDMTKNLGIKLEQFKENVKLGKANVEIRHRPGYTGGGALDAGYAFLLLLFGGLACLWRRA